MVIADRRGPFHVRDAFGSAAAWLPPMASRALSTTYPSKDDEATCVCDPRRRNLGNFADLLLRLGMSGFLINRLRAKMS
jgi:hypothetical protein